jgi:hypothetical protein
MRCVHVCFLFQFIIIIESEHQPQMINKIILTLCIVIVVVKTAAAVGVCQLFFMID